jgi:hypothetical protein
VSTLKKAHRRYHICAQLGHRSLLLDNIIERSKPFGEHFTDHASIIFSIYPFTDSVTCDKVRDALNSRIGQSNQVRFPLESVIRERVTAMNDRPEKIIRGNFYEGTQPRMVNLFSLSNFKCTLPYFEFDMVTCGNFCVHRLVDDVGMQLGTFACIDQLVLEKIDNLSVDDCLHEHQLYSEEILNGIRRYRRKYAAIIRNCDDGGDGSVKHISPW